MALDGALSWADIGAVMGWTEQHAEAVGREAANLVGSEFAAELGFEPIPEGHKACRHCGRVYEADRATGYCSDRCRAAAREDIKRGRAAVKRRLTSGRVMRAMGLERGSRQ